LGRDNAEAALAAGDSGVAELVATEELLAPLVAQYGARVKPVRLEVRIGTSKAAVHLAVEHRSGG